MLALQKTRDDKGVELREIPAPAPPGPGQVLIEVAATGICGSDLSIENWGASYSAFMTNALPVTLGHETAGVIAVVGPGVTQWKAGDRVVVNPAIACGKCSPCSTGDPVGCLDRQALGMVIDGAFARQFVAPADYLFALPENIPIELGALVEPLSVGAHALDVAGMKTGDRVLIFGPGPIGQGAAALARAFGAKKVALVGLNDAARFETLRKLGFDDLYDMADPGDAGRLKAGAGYDVAIDATGVPTVIDQALGFLRPEGVLAVAGMAEKAASLDMLMLVRNRLQIRGVSRIPPSIWPKVIDAIAADPEGFAPLISHRMPLSRAVDAFALCRSGDASKVLLIPSD